MRVTGIDHVQLAMPAGQEDIAREFYARTLGIPEVPKPPELAKRGGAWFEDGAGQDPSRRRSGLSSGAQSASSADRARPRALVATLRSKGHEIVPADGVPGSYRVHVFDPFGNRIELMEPLP